MKRIMVGIFFFCGSIQSCPTLVTRPGTLPDRITIFYNPPLFLLTCSVKKKVAKPSIGGSYEDKEAT